jgi:hypothetical protein
MCKDLMVTVGVVLRATAAAAAAAIPPPVAVDNSRIETCRQQDVVFLEGIIFIIVVF